MSKSNNNSLKGAATYSTQENMTKTVIDAMEENVKFINSLSETCSGDEIRIKFETFSGVKPEGSCTSAKTDYPDGKSYLELCFNHGVWSIKAFYKNLNSDFSDEVVKKQKHEPLDFSYPSNKWERMEEKN